jgi:hypothetical protein
MIESHIVHEDVWMRTFEYTSEEWAIDWSNDNLGIAPKGPITSFLDFFRIFLKHWDPHYEEKEYREFIDCFMALLPKEETAPQDPMEDQAFEEHIDEAHPIEDQVHEANIDEELSPFEEKEPIHEFIEHQRLEKESSTSFLCRRSNI